VRRRIHCIWLHTCRLVSGSGIVIDWNATDVPADTKTADSAVAGSAKAVDPQSGTNTGSALNDAQQRHLLTMDLLEVW